MVQHDALVVCDTTTLGARAVRGAPDLAVDILSPYSLSLDTKLKQDAYERDGRRLLQLRAAGLRARRACLVRRGGSALFRPAH